MYYRPHTFCNKFKPIDIRSQKVSIDEISSFLCMVDYWNYSVCREQSIDIHCCVAGYEFCSPKLQKVINMPSTYKSEMFFKLDLRKLKAVSTP